MAYLLKNVYRNVNVGQLFNTDAGQTVRNHMDMEVDRDISLWRSQQVVVQDEE